MIRRLQAQETLNFWITNRIPRNLLTRWVGRLSRVENRRLARVLIWVWQKFADDLRLEEAESREFASLQACFTRRLQAGARPLEQNPEVLVSPVDAEIGAFGRVENGLLLQAKGMVYTLEELLDDTARARLHHNGCYVTLRLKSSMYHRFHAPCDGLIQSLRYIGGEKFNVNPPSLKRIDRLFCRNERAILPMDTALGPITLVPVAAVLVASMRFVFLPGAQDPRSLHPRQTACDHRFTKGEELGHFEHGSTIIVFTGAGFEFDPAVAQGRVIRMGRALLRRSASRGPG